MKTQAEIKFNEILYACFHEKLKPLKFKKRAHNFYRNLGDLGQIINVQKSRYGSKDSISFTANIGIFSPVYWKYMYKVKDESEPPVYPTEPLCIIRKRIGQFIDGKDRWYDINGRTPLKSYKDEIRGIMDHKILPFFDTVKTNKDLVIFLEKEAPNRISMFKKFIIYGELGMRDKLLEIYPQLINECTRLQLRGIKEVARKYKIE